MVFLHPLLISQSPLNRNKNLPSLSLLTGLLLLCLLCSGNPSPAWALVKMDRESIDLALKYGMQQRGMGYMALLGPNWKEGSQGVLLNIYTPFMMLAAKSSRGGFSRRPDEEELKKARKYCRRLIKEIKDTKTPLRIKFSTSLYGDDPTFATQAEAWIEGFGRGKAYRLSPAKTLPQKKATDLGNTFEAVNAYYFEFKDIEKLEEYKFILQRPDADPVVLHLNNDEIY